LSRGEGGRRKGRERNEDGEIVDELIFEYLE
jgi:hypothetical protein